jgi:hypothetical protein
MLLSSAVLIAYLLAGIIIIKLLFPERSSLWRAWIGASLGVTLFMWLPALYAFYFDYTITAQIWALCTMGALTAITFIVSQVVARGDKASDKSIIDLSAACLKADSGTENKQLVLMFWALVPALTALSFYLQYTHTLEPQGGGLNVGQSTYGDLCLHLSIATSLRNAPFPPEYALLPGTRLAYPFLTDTLSTSLMLLGMPLRWSFIIPGTLMSAMVYCGILILAFQITKSARLSALALMLTVFCGGFGFLYMWDKLPADTSRFHDIFTEFYRAPANLVDENIRWSNLLADMWLPQRTFLGGWTLLLPALTLAADMPRTRNIKETLMLVVFAGALPLVHTHSFLALGLFSAGYLAPFILKKDGRARVVMLIAIYFIGTLALALPQMIAFTFRQSAAEGFVRLHFNWVNVTSDGRFIDTYIYFWIKNVGAPMLLIIPALFNMPREHRPVVAGAFTIFVVSDCVLFQPNEYDNNKLFYVWYVLMLPVALSFGRNIWRRLDGVKGRGVMAIVFIAAAMFAGALSVAREVKSDYQLFSPSAAKLGEYVEESTPADAMFLTATNHNNPVSALAGRKVVCGPDLYLHFHGLSYQQQAADVNRFYRDPLASLDVLDKYNVKYILYGDYERSISESAQYILDAAFPVVYYEGGYTLYEAVPIQIDEEFPSGYGA